MGRSFQLSARNNQVVVYPSTEAGAPLVYAIMHDEVGAAVVEACADAGYPPFTLASVTGMDWDGDLSPWPHDPVVSKGDNFLGNANDYTWFLAHEIIPAVEEALDPQTPTRRVIAGYSMGGLFALYALHAVDVFAATASVSGSLWYPDFMRFVQENDFCRVPQAVYLSVGDRESHTKNPLLRQTEDCARNLADVYASQGIRAVFELNPGNHFQDVPLRMARGIAWTLKSLSGRDDPGETMRGAAPAAGMQTDAGEFRGMQAGGRPSSTR